MAAPRIIVTGSTKVAPPRVASVASDPAAWDFLGWIGLVFTIVGLLDIALAWYPAALGSPEWEFGTVASTLNALSVPAIGLMLVLASGVGVGRRWQILASSIALFTLALALVAVAALFLTVLPVAFQDVSNQLARTGLLKAAAKTVVLLVIYPAVFVWAGFQGLRKAKGR